MDTYYYYEIIACELMRCNPAMLFEKTRKGEVNRARQLCMYYRHKFIGLSQAAAGARYDRDHATVVHTVKTINNLKETDKKIRDLYNVFTTKSDNAKKLWQKQRREDIDKRIGSASLKGYIDGIITNFMMLSYSLNNFAKGFGDEDAIRNYIDITEEDIIDLKILFKEIENKEIDDGTTD